MKLGILAALILISGSLIANEKHHSKKSLSAHEHGSVKLAIGVDNNVMEVDFDGPSESFVGFEYAPKTAKEKAKFEETKTLWEKNLLTILTPAAGLDCKITEASFSQEVEGSHAEIEAKAKVTCAKNLAGTELKVSLLKVFPKIKKLNAEIISQATATVKINKPEQVIKL